MLKKLPKINKLNNIESFIQVNLFKGYTFIDKAGEIINHFYRDKVPPTVPQISPTGMIILKPNDITEELKVAPDAIWAHYVNPNSLDQIATIYIKNLKDIAGILKVGSITRVGWRNYFVFEYTNTQEREQSLKKFTADEALKAELLVYSFELERVVTTLSISKLSKKDSKQTPAVLIDIDAYIVHDEPCTIAEAEGEIIELRKIIQSAEMLKKINLLIK